MLLLTGLDHVGLVVADLERSIAFYERLGMKCLRTSGPDEKGLRSAVIQAGAQELNLFSHPRLAPGSKAEAAGIDHFCLRIDAGSPEEVIESLRAAGLEVARGPIRRRDGTSFFLEDPDGIRVELQLRAAAGSQTATAGSARAPSRSSRRARR